MLHYFKILSAILCWTVAVEIGVDDPSPRGIGLSVFVATIACVPTFWLIIDHAADVVCRAMTADVLAIRESTEDLVMQTVLAERQRTEDVIQRVAMEFADHEVSRLDLRRHV